jgi:hypothetical protein
MMPHDELRVVEAMQKALEVLRRNAEKLPESYSTRLAVQSYLATVEEEVNDAVKRLRKRVGSQRGR